MSFIGGGIEASLAQLAQVQQAAAQGKDRERAAGESARRASDSVLLRVAGLEHSDAVRKAANDDSEREKKKKRQKRASEAGDPDKPKIDLRA